MAGPASGVSDAGWGGEYRCLIAAHYYAERQHGVPFWSASIHLCFQPCRIVATQLQGNIAGINRGPAQLLQHAGNLSQRAARYRTNASEAAAGRILAQAGVDASR